MPLFLAVRIKEKPGKISTISNITGILGGIALCIGILFKIMHWPFAGILMNIGGVLLILIFLPLYIYNGAKTKQLKTSTIVPVIVAVAGFSLMFSLVRLQSSNNVRNSRANYANNISQNIESTITFNEMLFEKLMSDSISNINSINSANQLASSINSLSNNIKSTFIKSNLNENNDAEIKKLEKTNFESFSTKMGLLSSIQNKENGLSHLLLIVENYKAVYTEITGTKVNLMINTNFDFYLNKQNEMFAFRFVLRDINFLNLHIQQMHTGLLQYYKGKVS
jgi:hypothetical protein